jgi:hypothetical protein
MSDARFLDGLYRQQARSNTVSKQIEEDISNGGADEELSMAFDKILQGKINDGVSYTVTAAYISYQHETVKSAINVV